MSSCAGGQRNQLMGVVEAKTGRDVNFITEFRFIDFLYVQVESHKPLKFPYSLF